MNNDHPNGSPKARTDQLIVKELADETLVYDLARDEAHCLNHTAALVWKNCDGRKSVTDIAASIESGIDERLDDRVVWLALDQLEKFNLLETPAIKPAHLAGLNRRQLVKTIGAAALALPVVISIATQTAQAQASPCSLPNRPDGCPCNTNGDCIPSHKCTGGFCAP